MKRWSLEGPLNKNTLRFFLVPALPLLFLSCFTKPLENEESIEAFLIRNQYRFAIDAEGDYKLSLSLEEGREHTVWIRRDLNSSGGEAVREIFSVAAVFEEERAAYLSRYFLQDNLQTRVMGSWAYMKNRENRQAILLYLIKLPLSTDEAYLKDALEEAAFAAEVMKKVLPRED